MSDLFELLPSTALADEDSAARLRALDVTQSFLVQAPAGSGKTELLIQRFLALLARVDRPERIVAVTFTRKAAGEMRERIVGALRGAMSGTPCDGTPHEERTRELALATLAQDQRHGWHLAAHPARLQVQTIDALCSAIARQAPLTTRLGAAPRCEERADWLYVQAARDALMAAAPGDPHWQRLLAHLDNDASAAVALLAEMLGKRDQWLTELPDRDPAALRARLEAALAIEIEGELDALRAAFSPALAAALVEHQRYAASNLADDVNAAALLRALRTAAGNGGLPPATLAHLQDWQILAGWLLRLNGAAFRKGMNVAGGFPPKAGGAGADTRGASNNAMKELLAMLAAEPRLAAALHAARRLPPPRYSDEAWAVAEALLTILPQVAAHLLLTFRTNGAVDFTQATMAALDALGTADEPTDLLLRIDFKLLHLLVDEFQDTSYTQLELIRRLTAGWQPGDGRTLFAVGDPMQSVYRFREAEVRLFVEAQARKRIGEIPVECLTLRCNFRAQAKLVDWVNAVFPRVLGARNEPWRGVVAFAEAMAKKPALRGPSVTLEVIADVDAESAAVVEHIRTSQAAGATDIAVLVRARPHLSTLLPALRAAQIPFSAVDLDVLAQRQAVQDLLSLTHALAQPADRLAWLSVLRAPWCGLLLPDLFAVMAAAGKGSIAATLTSVDTLAGLTDDGRQRLARTALALLPALVSRGCVTLERRVRGAWLALGGPGCVDEAVDLDAAECFFALLAKHEMAGEVADWSAFVAALATLHAEPDAAVENCVQVMTLHRAKGLQFDTVIVPGLARAPNRSNVQLLRWRRRPQGLLLAPMNARGGEDESNYRYLCELAADEEDAELGRLLYVGCTRAKQRLHLLAVLEPIQDESGRIDWKTPPSGSALMKLWPALRNAVALPAASAVAVPDLSAPPVLLSRLPLGWAPSSQRPDLSVLPQPDVIAIRESLPFDWARETARHVGTVAHRLFAQVATDGLPAWTTARLTAIRSRIRAELRGEGIDDSGMEAAAVEVETAIQSLLGDERGRWLFAPTHEDARSEWALAGVDGDAIVHIVIDRTFVADGVRWVVDFKTGTHEGADREAFLDRERIRYEPQLTRYARIVRALDPRPIRLALYYPLQRGWREWAFAG